MKHRDVTDADRLTIDTKRPGPGFEAVNKIVHCRVNAWKFQELAQNPLF